MTKTCRTCDETKPLSEFHRDKRSPDGRKARCRMCVNAAASTRRLAKRTEDIPPNLDYVLILAKRLSPPDQRHLWELLRPAAKLATLFPDAFDSNFFI